MLGFLTRTIYRKFFLLILFVSLVPAAVGIFQSYVETQVMINSTIGDYLCERSINLANTLDGLIASKIQAFSRLKENPDFHDLISKVITQASTISDLHNILDELQKNTLLSDDVILLYDVNGARLFTSDDTLETEFSGTGWWKDISTIAEKEIFIGDKMIFKERESGDLATSIPSAEPYLFLFTRILLDETAIQNGPLILALGIDCNGLLEPIISKRISGESLNLTIYSETGRILYPSDSTQTISEGLRMKLASRENIFGWFEISTPEHKRIYAYSELFQRGVRTGKWLVANPLFIIEDIDLSNSQIISSLTFWRTSIISFSLAFIFCLAGIFVARKMVMPLKQLNWTVQRVAGGYLNDRIEVKTRDEIGVLAENFNIMIARLNATYQQLAEKITELDEKAKQISLIFDITRAINSELQLEETFKAITTEMRKLVNYDRISICLLDPETNRARLVYVEPKGRRLLPKGSSITMEDSTIADAMRTGVIITRNDLGTSPCNEEEILLAQEGMQSLIVLPLKSKNIVIGTLNIASKKAAAYGESTRELLLKISEGLAVAIEHSRMFTLVSHFADELEKKVEERTEELKQAHHKLTRAEKFAAAGQLAANLAHEINNPLQIIKNYLKMLMRQIEQPQQYLEMPKVNIDTLNVINEELDRIARIIRSLLDFYRTPDMRVIPIDINQEIKSLITLMEKNLERRQIKPILKLSLQLPSIMSSIDPVRQVLLNILRNAEDAMELGGELIISTEMQVNANKKAGEFVIVSIRDTGIGIPPQHMDKIFDPFFTTKKADKGGTGLGLSVSYGIMKSLGGDIEIKSVPQQGTTVILSFPVITRSPSEI